MPARVGKASDVTELSDDDQRGQGVDAPEAPEPPDRRAIRLLRREGADLGIERGDAGLELFDGAPRIVEDVLIRGVGEPQRVEPAPMHVGPGSLARGIADAAAEQEGAEPLPAAQQVLVGGRLGQAEVADGFLGLVRWGDLGEQPRPV